MGMLTETELDEMKEVLNRIERKLDMLIIRLLPNEPLLAEPRRDRELVTREWLKNLAPESTWKRTHAI